MISLILLSLEKLQADLAAIDPARDTEAAGAIADLARALRDRLAAAEDGGRMPSEHPMQGRAAGGRGCPFVPNMPAAA